ncbi:SDR family NAD(P)-dependent oxidoreductase [Gemmiger sp. An50]|uniref:SDR family NAD(P)-dependent oxidoreductase n=1 Tax=Gemmiger sp. An50 TaxID=1965639 RepID=UPI0013A65B47|nr:SDR family NAD(P)-dependent oxidoreductase [Gemmiger sp. An50]
MSEERNNLMDYTDKVCVVTGSASGIGRAVCELLIAQGAVVYGLDCNEYLPHGMAQFIHTDLSDKASIDHAFTLLPEHIHCFFGVAGLSGAKTDWWTTFTVNFSANKYITETYLEKRMKEGDAIAYVTSTGGLLWEKMAERIPCRNGLLHLGRDGRFYEKGRAQKWRGHHGLFAFQAGDELLHQ